MEYSDKSDPGEIIYDRGLKILYERFLDGIRGMHDDVVFEVSRVEVLVSFRETLLCRIVPYRELFHVQIGKNNPWEIRVRDEATGMLALDRVLEAFLDRFATAGPISGDTA